MGRTVKIVSLLDDAVSLLLVVLALPIVVLLVGSPIALAVWVVLAIARQLLN
jgi:hypothetical protein